MRYLITTATMVKPIYKRSNSYSIPYPVSSLQKPSASTFDHNVNRLLPCPLILRRSNRRRCHQRLLYCLAFSHKTEVQGLSTCCRTRPFARVLRYQSQQQLHAPAIRNGNQCSDCSIRSRLCQGASAPSSLQMHEYPLPLRFVTSVISTYPIRPSSRTCSRRTKSCRLVWGWHPDHIEG